MLCTDSALKIKILHIIFFIATPMINNITNISITTKSCDLILFENTSYDQLHFVHIWPTALGSSLSPPAWAIWWRRWSLLERRGEPPALASTATSLMWAQQHIYENGDGGSRDGHESWWCHLYFKSSFCGFQGLGGVREGVQTHWSAAGRTWIRFLSLPSLSSP